MGYTAIGEQVGMAQRMESVAPPGGVMLSESTARLVEDAVVLGEPEMVRIKGADRPVTARRLARDRRSAGTVGRQRADPGRARLGDEHHRGDARPVDRRRKGRIVGVVGPPGIGKSRMVA